MAALGLHCCARAFSSCGERGLLFVAVHGLPIAVASLCCGARALAMQALVVVARGFSSCGSRALERRLSSCGAQAWLLCGMWDLPSPGLEPMSPALAGGFLTTVPPGKAQIYHFEVYSSVPLSTFILLCNHHHHLSPELFHLPKLKLHPH